ncbi:hypothetical protein MMSR116_18410 [Methylobacterium mesophilicum SR1.6/6]|uniref:Uncharacterized protein n=1 Tax=Methylobacterium mesophilicum SR1.6/6 TaxID=908290 RepID=A0A6B9FM72_9HYPH|nr:hypothetical protein [Methylobacterium mesophilicum]QGY03643.1 hypothetical protein MMSR116_18410 [Methylobacterium mesophilicum SR1.6/6]
MRPTVMFLLLPLAVVAGIGQSEIKRRFFSSDNINEQSHVISYSDVYPAVDPNASTLYAQITNENINATCVEAKFEDFCEGKNVIFHKKFSVNNDGSSSYLTNDAVGTDDPYLNFHFQKPINALYDGAEIEIYGKIKKVSGRFFTVSDSRIVRLIKTKKQLQDAESAKQAQLDADIAANLKSFRQACYDAYSAAPVGAARLACVKPAASVRSEPGSNSHVEEKDPADHVIVSDGASHRPSTPTLHSAKIPVGELKRETTDQHKSTHARS